MARRTRRGNNTRMSSTRNEIQPITTLDVERIVNRYTTGSIVYVSMTLRRGSHKVDLFLRKRHDGSFWLSAEKKGKSGCSIVQIRNFPVFREDADFEDRSIIRWITQNVDHIITRFAT